MSVVVGQFSAGVRVWFASNVVLETWEGPRPTGVDCATRFSAMLQRDNLRMESQQGLHLPEGGDRHQ